MALIISFVTMVLTLINMSYGLVVKALVFQSKGPMFKTKGWLQDRLSL